MPKYLRHTKTKQIWPYHEQLAKREDVEVFEFTPPPPPEADSIEDAKASKVDGRSKQARAVRAQQEAAKSEPELPLA